MTKVYSPWPADLPPVFQNVLPGEAKQHNKFLEAGVNKLRPILERRGLIPSEQQLEAVRGEFKQRTVTDLNSKGFRALLKKSKAEKDKKAVTKGPRVFSQWPADLHPAFQNVLPKEAKKYNKFLEASVNILRPILKKKGLVYATPSKQQMEAVQVEFGGRPIKPVGPGETGQQPLKKSVSFDVPDDKKARRWPWGLAAALVVGLAAGGLYKFKPGVFAKLNVFRRAA